MVIMKSKSNQIKCAFDNSIFKRTVNNVWDISQKGIRYKSLHVPSYKIHMNMKQCWLSTMSKKIYPTRLYEVEYTQIMSSCGGVR